MDSKDLVTRLEASEYFRPSVLSARQELLKACTAVSEKAKCEISARSSYNSSNSRFAELTSGRGSIIAKAGPATLYEFWIDIPGYSGSVKGAKARLTQRGDVHQVSDVKGATKGGLGGAAIGALAFGPAGAIVGAVVGRKTTVKTDVREVDSRQFELEIIGPGFAWSIVDGPDQAATFQKFRDLVNARGSRTDNVKALADAQSSIVARKHTDVKSAQAEYKSAFDFADQKQAAYDHVWNDYLIIRLPILLDIRTRWMRSNLLSRFLVTLIGPVILLAWISGYFMGKLFTDPTIGEVAVIVGMVHIAIIIGIIIYYFTHFRLIKSNTKLPN